MDVATVGGMRARNRAAIEAEITRIAREHLIRFGAAGLSLRAVARELGMVSSAVYRYVESRDELLTRLIVDAYTSLGDAVDAALAALPAGADAEQRFRAIGLATRTWALANPHEYALVYGSPVPGYHAPPERTVAPGTRVTQRLIEALGTMPGSAATTARDLRAMGEGPEDMPAELGVPAGAIRRGITAWNLVLGSITAELFEQYGADFAADPDAFFDAVLDDAFALARGL